MALKAKKKEQRHKASGLLLWGMWRTPLPCLDNLNPVARSGVAGQAFQSVGVRASSSPGGKCGRGANSPLAGRGEDTSTPRNTGGTPAGDHLFCFHPTAECPLEDICSTCSERRGKAEKLVGNNREEVLQFDEGNNLSNWCPIALGSP